jgi:excisionase family DNA binding protein
VVGLGFYSGEAAAAMTDRVLTAKDVANYLRLSEHTILRLAREGQIPSFTVGASRRFDFADVRAYIEGQKGSRMGEVVELRRVEG